MFTTDIRKNLEGYITVACIAAATIGLELVQTRILSALYYNHIVYLTVTIALMGFGIAGVAVSLLSNCITDWQKPLAICSGAFAGSIVLSIYIVSRLPMWYPNAPITTKLVYSYLLLMLPFLCSGTVLGLIFMRNGADIFRFYCADLMASALACGAFVLLLNPLGASGFVWVCVALACAAFVLLARAAKLPSLDVYGFLIAAFALYMLCGTHLVNNQPEPYKTLAAKMRIPGAHIEATEWTPITRLDVINMPGRGLDLSQDSDAHTPFIHSGVVNGIINGASHGQNTRGSVTLGYFMHAPHPDQSLVIGVGGGIDLVASHAYGAVHTTGVEINGVTARLTNGSYANYLVWPHWPDVKEVVEEGRHYVRSHPHAYDTITMSGIDTFSALNSGAYVLSENYLYTTEAFEDYLRGLRANGIMTINRWFEAIPPRESLRLASLHVEASKRLGIEHPEKNIFVVVDNDWASTFIKAEPFTPEEIHRAFEKIEKTRLRVVYLPKIFPPEEQAAIEKGLAAGRNAGLNVANDAYEHVINPQSPEAEAKFLDDYPLDVSPVFDDRPFFFEYHKGLSIFNWSHDDNRIRKNVKNNLYILLLVCLVVSACAIVGPLMIFNRQGLKTQGAPSLLLYFACLGLGFMMVEIGMMQRLSLYLGDPMHSMLVVLSGLLLFAGAGTYLSGQLNVTRQHRFLLGTCGSAVAVLGWIIVMPTVIWLTQEWYFGLRVIITLLSMLPVGLVLGIPFATGLEYLSGYCPRFIPWAWGINGLTSVLASILAIIIAMQVGFTIVLVIGAGIYALGLFAIRAHVRNAAH